jgi:hypothetical protein
MHQMRCPNPRPTLSRLLPRTWAAALKPTFLFRAGFERWLGALEFGALRLGCAAKADDLASGSDEIFKGDVHATFSYFYL